MTAKERTWATPDMIEARSKYFEATKGITQPAQSQTQPNAMDLSNILNR